MWDYCREDFILNIKKKKYTHFSDFLRYALNQRYEELSTKNLIAYQFLSRIVLLPMIRDLDFHQPREQARFGSGFSTTDHMFIHTISHTQEWAKEWKKKKTHCASHLPIVRRHSNFIESEPLSKAFEHQGFNPRYITIIRDIYNEATSVLKIHKDNRKIQPEGGARQVDNNCLKLFTYRICFIKKKFHLDYYQCYILDPTKRKRSLGQYIIKVNVMNQNGCVNHPL